MILSKIFSYNLRYYRLKANYTQEKLAELADLNTKTLSNYERCIALSFEAIDRLAKALNIEPYLLFKEPVSSTPLTANVREYNKMK